MLVNNANLGIWLVFIGFSRKHFKSSKHQRLCVKAVKNQQAGLTSSSITIQEASPMKLHFSCRSSFVPEKDTNLKIEVPNPCELYVWRICEFQLANIYWFYFIIFMVLLEIIFFEMNHTQHRLLLSRFCQRWSASPSLPPVCISSTLLIITGAHGRDFRYWLKLDLVTSNPIREE